VVERLLSMQEAQGSIPCSSTFFALLFLLFIVNRTSKVGSSLLSTGWHSQGLRCVRVLLLQSHTDAKGAHSSRKALVGDPFVVCSVRRAWCVQSRVCRNTKKEDAKKSRCLDRGSNTGPLDLQSSALPTELSKHVAQGVSQMLSWTRGRLLRPPFNQSEGMLLFRGVCLGTDARVLVV
jgi:hypothetical protein